MPFSPADRLKALPTYLFVEIDRKKRAAREAGRDVIDFGIGDPDRPTPAFIVERMQAAVADPANHRYPFDEGAKAFRQAIVSFMQQRYGVTLDAAREVWGLIGSKEGIAHLPLAVLNPGDVSLVPEPGYPVYRSSTILAGGEPYTLPLTEARGWLPDLTSVPSDIARRARLLFLNYPNNPTGAVASLEFFQEVVDFARQHDLVLAHDAAYSELYFDQPVPSVLQVPGARDVAIELHSASKTFNMTGWRVGFAVGHADVVAALGRTKSIIDSGVFSAVQQAAMAAYEGYRRPEITATLAMYRERAEALVRGLRECGFRVADPRATFYVWAGVPQGQDSFGVAGRLLDEADVVCVPGAGFGPAGEGYVRFALTVDVGRIRQALDRMRKLKWQRA